MIARGVKSVLLAAVLTFAPAVPAHASVVFVITGAFAGDTDQSATYNFLISTPGTYEASLSNLLLPAIKGLELVVAVTGGPTALADIVGPGSEFFPATSAGSYTALVFGHPSARPTGIFGGAFGVEISTPTPAPTPVPEPGIWLMMLGGIGLLGWMRLRRSENFS